MKGSYHDAVRAVAAAISEHISANNDLSVSSLSRACRLQYGIGRQTILRIIKEDYPDYFVDGDSIRRRE